jgi:hypothetical protein
LNFIEVHWFTVALVALPSEVPIAVVRTAVRNIRTDTNRVLQVF